MNTAIFSYPLKWRLLSFAISGFILCFSIFTIYMLSFKGAMRQNPGVFFAIVFICFFLITMSVYQLLSFPSIKMDEAILFRRCFFQWFPIRYSDISSLKTVNTENIRLPLPAKKSLTIITVKGRSILSKYLFIGDGIQNYPGLLENLKLKVINEDTLKK